MNIEISEKQAQSMMNAFGISPINIESFYPRMMEPLAKPSELNLTAREFFYWCDKGIIDIPKSKDGQSPWSRLTLLDVIWIRIVKELRRFNFPFSSIVKIKEDLFQNMLIKLFDSNDSELESVIKNINDDIRETFITIIKQGKKDPDAIKKELGPLACPLGGLLAEILILNRKIHLRISKKGDDFSIVFEGYSFEHTSKEKIDTIKNETHLSLCLNELIADYLLDAQCERINIEFGLISDKEIEILEAIRNKEVVEITIKKDHDEKLVFTTTKRSELKNENIETLKRILRMNEFDDVRVVLRNDKHIYLENKTRKKL